MWKRVINWLETEIDDIKYGFDKLSGMSDPIEIKCYPGFGNDHKLIVKGRVLRKRETPSSKAADGEWRNFLNVTRNWFTDEVPHARLEISYGEDTCLVTADEEGYFKGTLPGDRVTPSLENWIDVQVRLITESKEPPVTSTAHVQVPCRESEFGIISDIDDTVMETDATSLLAMMKNTFLRNSHTRLVFDGVSAFYAALTRGNDGRGSNPFFYVTSSPWNLHDLIVRVFELRGVPRGTFFMTDWGLDDSKFLMSGHHDHKTAAIESVLETYPKLPFLLIGDSGQKDPEIYSHILEKYPKQILAIYIRDVTQDKRDAEVRNLKETAEKHGVDLILAPDTAAMAQNAASHAWIRDLEIPAIEGQIKADRMERGA